MKKLSQANQEWTRIVSMKAALLQIRQKKELNPESSKTQKTKVNASSENPWINKALNFLKT